MEQTFTLTATHIVKLFNSYVFSDINAGAYDYVNYSNNNFAKINAIKNVRDASGMGLKDAKDFVEAIFDAFVATMGADPKMLKLRDRLVSEAESLERSAEYPAVNEFDRGHNQGEKDAAKIFRQIAGEIAVKREQVEFDVPALDLSEDEEEEARW